MNETELKAIDVKESNMNYAILMLRVSLGIMFVAHGLLKLLVFTLPGTAQFFGAQGFPTWMAYPVTFMEIIGGVMLIAGLATRSVALALMPILLGAIYVHLTNGWVFSNANGGWEYPAFLLVALIVQAMMGPGRYVLRLPVKSTQMAGSA